MSATTHIAFDLTPGGLEQAQAELDRIRDLFEQRGSQPRERVPGEVVYRNCHGHRSRRLLELLPDRKDQAKTFEELGRDIPMDNGSPGTKASVRAAFRNVKRVENRLQQTGEIDREVILVDRNNYGIEGANRYWLSPEDKGVIDDAAKA